MNEESRTLREVVSKESGLWQFCCENGMVEEIQKKWKEENLKSFEYTRNYENYEYQYRLIESALCDEDKLEEFLLKNIKVND